MIAFTLECSDVSGDELALLFASIVRQRAMEYEANGVQVCPEANLTDFLTPCGSASSQ
jgi:hypothetical protein